MNPVAAHRIATDKTLVMGVLNVTPDSFYAPSTALEPTDARKRAEQLVADGAHIVDIGGESSRPGADPVSLEEEVARITPVFNQLDALDARLSIDTYRAETARQAIARGATMVNDITALQGDPEMARVIAETGVECVLMHMQGSPADMQNAPRYDNVIEEICAFFRERLDYATLHGVAEEKIWLDPGFGFGKTVEHNLAILRELGEFKRFGRPVMIGTSNKSTIGSVLDLPIDQRSEGTAATVAVAICNGADAIRVHDVRGMARVARMTDAVLGKVNRD